MTASPARGLQSDRSSETSIGKLAILFLVLAGVFVFVANLLIWIDRTVFDSEEFTEVTQETLSEPQVQEHIGQQLAARVVESEQLMQRVEEQLPANLDPVAPVVIEQLEPVIAEVATRIIAAERTGQIATETIPALHSELLAILEDDDNRLAVQGDSLVLHLSGPADRVAERLAIDPSEAQGGGSSSGGDIVLIEDATYLQLASVVVSSREEFTFVMLVGAVAGFGLAGWRIGNAHVTLQKISIVAVAVGAFTLLTVLASNWILADVFPDRFVIRELLKTAEENLNAQSLFLVVIGAVGIAATDAGVRKSAVDAYTGGASSVSGAFARYGAGRLMLVAAAAIVILVFLF